MTAPAKLGRRDYKLHGLCSAWNLGRLLGRLEMQDWAHWRQHSQGRQKAA